MNMNSFEKLTYALQISIIKSKIISSGKKINIESNFSILLKDFGIKIPKVVNQKIAEEILVSINLDMNIKQ